MNVDLLIIFVFRRSELQYGTNIIIDNKNKLLPPTKEVHVFARFCLSVCLLSRLLKNACMNFNEILRVDRCLDMDELINF